MGVIVLVSIILTIAGVFLWMFNPSSDLLIKISAANFVGGLISVLCVIISGFSSSVANMLSVVGPLAGLVLGFVKGDLIISMINPKKTRTMYLVMIFIPAVLTSYISKALAVHWH